MFSPTRGAIVAGRYELEDVIGRGGMGEVWRAHDRDLDSPCAVKFILDHLARDEALRARFVREAKLVARLRSPHAVHILGVGEHEGALYLAMELLEGETLQTRLQRVGRLAPEVTFAIIEQVGQALEKAHEAGIVHRDLKPDNIWLWAEAATFVKVLDFGVAKSLHLPLTLHTATGSLVGTPHYMSPEQAKGTRDVDHRSDLWALAVITMQCLTGKRPFESQGLGELLIQIATAPVPAVTELAPELPPGLQAWWERALARDPAQRFQSAGELVRGLQPHLALRAASSPETKPSSEEGRAAGASSARTAPVPLVPSEVKEPPAHSMSPLVNTRPPARRLTAGRAAALMGAAAVALLGLLGVARFWAAERDAAPKAPSAVASAAIDPRETRPAMTSGAPRAAARSAVEVVTPTPSVRVAPESAELRAVSPSATPPSSAPGLAAAPAPSAVVVRSPAVRTVDAPVDSEVPPVTPSSGSAPPRRAARAKPPAPSPAAGSDGASAGAAQNAAAAPATSTPAAVTPPPHAPSGAPAVSPPAAVPAPSRESKVKEKYGF